MTRRVISREKWEWPVLVAILVLATLLRVANPALTEFKFSEARLEALALELTREGRLPLIGVPSSAGFDHSPISIYLYVPAFLLTTDPIPATIYGGLIGAIAVALCWWLARRWSGGGPYAALIAALLFAVSPWLVAFSRKIWQVAFVPLLTLTFIGLVISALVEDTGPHGLKQRGWHLTLAIVVYALLVQVHPSAISLAPALLLWLLLFWRSVRLGSLLAGGVLGMVTTIPFLVHQFQGDWPVLAAYRSLPEARWDLSAARLAWEVITGRSIHALAGDGYPLLDIVPQFDGVFNLVGWLTAVASCWLLWRMVAGWRAEEAQRSRAARIDFVLLTWLAIPVALNFRHNLDLHLHFFALIAPAAFLLIGRAAESGFTTVQSSTAVPTWARALKILGGLGLALLAAAQVVALLLMARFVATHDTPGGFGMPLGRHLEFAEQALKAAESTGAAEVLVVGGGDSVVVDETPAIFDVLLRDRIAYRFVDGQSAAVFPSNPALVLLAAESGESAEWYEPWPTQELQDGYRLVTLDGSWPQQGLQPISGSRLFQNGVEFQGYAWEPSQQGRGQFWLLWQVLWLSPEDTHFFAHLVEEGGRLWGQRDSTGYPAALRHKGDRVVSLFDIKRQGGSTAEPDWARAGLYSYPEVVNVPVIDEAGNPISDVVVIGPLGGEP